MSRSVRTPMHRGRRELVGSGPGPTDFLSRQTKSVARGRRSWMLARSASGDTASEPPRPGRKGERGTVGPVASWAGSVSKVFPAVDVLTFCLSGLVSKNRDLRLEKLPEDAQKHRRFPDVSAR